MTTKKTGDTPRSSGRESSGRERALGGDDPLLYGGVGESPVVAGSHADAEGLDGFQYVTGEVPYTTQEEMLLDQERTQERVEDDRDLEAPEEVMASRVAFDERDDVNTLDDVDRQGRRGEEERDWSGDMFADSGRHRLSDGSRKRR
ncbi:MAG: hypothetical protein Q8P18_28750 [Pseudomonadota bacterium]|nr:hypothetical protein [Pseudomonadota bacterium]